MFFYLGESMHCHVGDAAVVNKSCSNHQHVKDLVGMKPVIKIGSSVRTKVRYLVTAGIVNW